MLQQQLVDAEMLSTTLFLLIGIPILRAAMSRVVDWLIDRSIRAVPFFRRP